MTDLSALRVLAEKATPRYAYLYHHPFGGTTLRFNNGEKVNAGKPFKVIKFYSEDDCNPQVMLDLIARIERLEAEEAAWRRNQSAAQQRAQAADATVAKMREAINAALKPYSLQVVKLVSKEPAPFIFDDEDAARASATPPAGGK